jgi:imidazolonepropionase-like amidohydrolase
MEDQIGILQSGMVADIVAVPGDPLEDITRLQAVDFVMKEGTVYRQSEPGDGR